MYAAVVDFVDNICENSCIYRTSVVPYTSEAQFRVERYAHTFQNFINSYIHFKFYSNGFFPGLRLTCTGFDYYSVF